MSDNKFTKTKRLCLPNDEQDSGASSRNDVAEEKRSMILNDFCLLQIFNRLDINDLCNVVNVSKQFRRVSMMAFSERYKTFCYPESLCLGITMALHRPRMRRVLCNFGHLIQSLKIKDFDPAGVFIGIRFYPIEMDAISKYCAGTLEELNLNIFVKFDCDLAKPTLTSLKSLTIYCSGFFEGDAIGLFSGCNELKTLRLRRISCPYMPSMACVVAQRYPKLEQLHIDDYLLNAETFYALLKSNLQLKKLNIFVQTASKSICAVAIELENLEELVLNGVESDYDNVSAFGNLKSLKVLELHNIDDGFVPALNAMGDVPLERFRWFDCPSNVEFTKSIKKMKTQKFIAGNDLFTII